jgi:hypothetical protein
MRSISFRSVVTRVLSLAPLALVASLAACMAAMPKPNDIIAPSPISGNTGKYLSPYTSDGTVAQWVVKGRAAKLGGAIGSFAGRKAGEAALSQVPIIGGWLGGKAGDKAGREIALNWVGGEQTLRATSDLSFNRIDDLIVFLYTTHYDEKNKDWQETYDLTKAIYPDLESRWDEAIKKAPRKHS